MTAVGVDAVVAAVAGLPTEDEAPGKRLLVVGPGGDGQRQEVEVGASEVADDGFAGGLLPERLGQVIPHDHVANPQVGADAEAQGLVVDDPAKADGGITQRTVGGDDRLAADRVVDDFVPREDLQRLGAALAAVLEDGDRLAVVEELVTLGQ